MAVTIVPMPASVNSSSSSECGLAAVDDVRRPDPAANRVDAGRSFGRIPPADRAERRLDLVDGGARDQRASSAGVVEPALDVGEEDRLVGAERGGDLAGRLVGVDVVGVALAVGAGRGDHRDVVGGDVVEHVDVDPLDLADEADLLGVGDRRDLEQRAVLAGEPDRRLAVAVEPHDDVRVDLAEQDHLRHLDRLGVGDPQALDGTGPPSRAAPCTG